MDNKYLKNIKNGRIFPWTPDLEKRAHMLYCDESGNLTDSEGETQGIIWWQNKNKATEKELQSALAKIAVLEGQITKTKSEPVEPEIESIPVDMEELLEGTGLTPAHVKEEELGLEFNGFRYRDIIESVKTFDRTSTLRKWAMNQRAGLSLEGLDRGLSLEAMRLEIFSMAGICGPILKEGKSAAKKVVASGDD